MAQHIGNIKVKGLKKNKPKLSAGDCILPFFQDSKTLKNVEFKNKFIKATEKLVRRNIRYSQYKAFLAEEKGLDFCQIHPNIKSNDNKIPIEMHHGPLLTLYDICEIVTNAMINRGAEDLTTFKIAKIVLEEHRLHNVQVVMLCEDCHDIFHSGGWIYINPKQAWGNLERFLKKWYDGLTDELVNTINENLRIARKYESNDNGVLDASGGKSWKDALNNK